VKSKHQIKKDIPVVERLKVHKGNENSKKPNCLICINNINIAPLKKNPRWPQNLLNGKHTRLLSSEGTFFWTASFTSQLVCHLRLFAGSPPPLYDRTWSVPGYVLIPRQNFPTLSPTFMEAQVVTKEWLQPLKFKLRQRPAGAPATLGVSTGSWSPCPRSHRPLLLCLQTQNTFTLCGLHYNRLHTRSQAVSFSAGAHCARHTYCWRHAHLSAAISTTAQSCSTQPTNATYGHLTGHSTASAPQNTETTRL